MSRPWHSRGTSIYPFGIADCVGQRSTAKTISNFRQSFLQGFFKYSMLIPYRQHVIAMSSHHTCLQHSLYYISMSKSYSILFTSKRRVTMVWKVCGYLRHAATIHMHQDCRVLVEFTSPLAFWGLSAPQERFYPAH